MAEYKIKFTDGMREHLLSKADMSGYESPINIAVGEMRMAHEKHIEGEVFKAIREVGISVDREELLKALRYDRQQYEQGYIAGYARAEIELLPAADVVARAQYEKLFDECENQSILWKQHFESLYETAKKVFVSEIFAEIEKSVALKIPPHICFISKNDLGFENGLREGKKDALREVLFIVAELKKKYTEGEK